jgi:hypothetical protein
VYLELAEEPADLWLTGLTILVAIGLVSIGATGGYIVILKLVLLLEELLLLLVFLPNFALLELRIFLSIPSYSLTRG